VGIKNEEVEDATVVAVQDEEVGIENEEVEDATVENVKYLQQSFELITTASLFSSTCRS